MKCMSEQATIVYISERRLRCCGICFGSHFFSLSRWIRTFTLAVSGNTCFYLIQVTAAGHSRGCIMLSSVCCIIDVDGFDIRNYDEYKQYKTEFLVRELGYIRVDPNYHLMPKSYRFDLRKKVKLERCAPKVRQTLNYQSQNVIGLTILPRPDERDVIDYDCLKKVVQDIHDFCRRANANVVAYKGGDKERKLLESLNIVCVDLQGFGCPTYKDLVNTRKVYSELQDCGYHTELKGNGLVHCPKAEVTAYRDWFMKNYKRFSTPA